MNAQLTISSLASFLPRLPSPQAGGKRFWVGLLAGALIPFACLLVTIGLERTLGVRTPNMIFLSGVILAAISFGRTVALCTAVLSFAVYNFFLSEPYGIIEFGGPIDLLTIVTFLAAAIVIGGMAGALHDDANRAREQVRILTDLVGASQAMAERRDAKAILHVLLEAAQRLYNTPVALFEKSDGAVRMIESAPADASPPEVVVQQASSLLSGAETPVSEEASLQWRIRQMAPDGAKDWALAWREPRGAHGDQQVMAGELLMKLANDALERTQAAEREALIEAMAATDKLRTTLLSSISHDFRTPLATITASASSLLAYGDTFPESTRNDLLTSIQQEAERLNRFVGNVLDMTRLEAGALRPRSELTDPTELIENMRERMSKRSGEHRLVVNTPAALPAIDIDPVLLEQAILNVLDNAMVHTPPGSTIEIGARAAESALHLWIEDNGPGVNGDELEHVFDKFYRPAASNHSAGLGLGLAISKGFVEAMNGTVTASSPARAGRGLRIEFIFPAPAIHERA